jgi:L,D-transpeptidase catalytic domain
LERSWFSTAYYNSPMPYSIFFHNGYAIHGSYAINQLGGPASHGCVRLHPHHAALLFDLVQQEGPSNTTIEITDEPRPEQASLPGREIAAPGREIAAPGREIAAPGREIVAPGREIVAPGREIVAGQGSYPPVTRIERYREPGDMPELVPVQRGNRPIAVKNASPPRPPPPPPAGRRLLADVRPAASPARTPCGGEADTANESPDCRPKPKVVEAPPPEQPQQARPKPRVAEAPSPEQPQQAPSVYGFKLLPSSCWTGGASRWRWWGSGQGTPCR